MSNPVFTEGFKGYVCDGDKITAEKDRFRFVAELVRDDYCTPLDFDGHGPVSGWERRDAKQWERIVATDRWGARRFYDYRKAVQIAIRDGWGANGGRREDETPREYAKRAALEDYEVIRAWFADEWCYFDVVVRVYKAGVKLGEASCGGFEGNYPGGDNAYLLEAANDLVGEALEDARSTLAKLTA